MIENISIPDHLALVYLLASLVTFCAYAWDKQAARQGTWRIPEKTLHMLDLACGWPGGLLAQRVLRHKTRKVSFQVAFWVTVLLNVVLVLPIR